MKRRTGGNFFKLVLCLTWATALRESGKSQVILDIQIFPFLLENSLKDLIHFSGKGCLRCAMHNNSHSVCIWEEYSGERATAMEWEHREREPCLSPAAFVNQVQYSNILEGRFKQLQGKRCSDLVLFHLVNCNICLPTLVCLDYWSQCIYIRSCPIDITG